jgi:putative Holliday junction resolvase
VADTAIAIDLGKRRIGIAIADNEGLAVHPIGAIERRSLVRDLESIRARLVEFEVSHVIVGLPLNMDGSAGPAARAAETFAARLREACGLPVDLLDERSAALEAEERWNCRARTRGQRLTKEESIVAAGIIPRAAAAEGMGSRSETDISLKPEEVSSSHWVKLDQIREPRAAMQLKLS